MKHYCYRTSPHVFNLDFFGRMRNFLVCRLKFDIVYDDVNNQCVFAMSPFHLHCRVWYDWLPRYAFLMLLYVIMKSIVCVHCRKVFVFILSVISIFQKKSILLYSRLRCLFVVMNFEYYFFSVRDIENKIDDLFI